LRASTIEKPACEHCSVIDFSKGKRGKKLGLLVRCSRCELATPNITALLDRDWNARFAGE